jgi:hypothetical protein
MADGLRRASFLALVVCLAARCAGGAPTAAAAPVGFPSAVQYGVSPLRSYAIVVSRKTLADAAWKKVVDALTKKYDGRVFTFDADIGPVQAAVAACAPRYVCFVANPAEASRKFVEDAARFIRTLDDDPYEDAIWAILTGYEPADALRIATAEPLAVACGVSHVTDGWLEWMEEGVSWSEVVKNRKYVKAKGEKLREVEGPDDTTREMVAEINRGQCQIVSTSGHAKEHDWQLGYTYPNGIFASYHGRIVGITLKKEGVEIRSPNPKVYFSPGNCLIGHVADMDCMALAWIHSGGANQFFGHTVPQYRRCWAWEIADYFFTLQGRFSFTEAVHLFRQDVLARLEQSPDEETKFFLNSDRDSTVLYGDPAWQARLKPATEPLYDQTLAIVEEGDGRLRLDFTVKARRACAPSAPAAAMLPRRIQEAKVIRTDAAKAIVTKDLILLRLLKDGEKPLAAGETRSVSITARTAAGLKRRPPTHGE